MPSIADRVPPPVAPADDSVNYITGNVCEVISLPGARALQSAIRLRAPYWQTRTPLNGGTTP
eukprot:6678047-Prymnesium_polylepis.1